MRKLLTLCCVISVSTVSAAVITRDVIIDLETDGSVLMWPDHQAWHDNGIAIEDTTIATGDTLLININFANSQSLILTNSGTNPLNSGLESTNLFLNPSETSNISFRASGTLTFVGVSGDLLSNPTLWDIKGGGGAFVGPSLNSNLTDTSFSYSGVNIVISFDPADGNENNFSCNSGSCIFNELRWISGAENVEVVPIPAAVWLFGSGLLGLFGFTSRKRAL